MNYNVLRELLDEGSFLQYNCGAEVGIFEASTSRHLLRFFPQLHLHCIDPFVAYDEHEHDKTQEKMSAVEQTARAALEPFGERAHIIKDFSEQAAAKIADNSLDFVFIDAIHTYDAVLSDLRCWYPKVRPNGLVSGHDYSWPGVKEAVETFIAPLETGAYFTPSTSDVWFFVK